MTWDLGGTFWVRCSARDRSRTSHSPISAHRHVCSPLRSRSGRPTIFCQLCGVLNHLLVVHVVIVVFGTTLIRQRTPIGPGALVVRLLVLSRAFPAVDDCLCRGRGCFVYTRWSTMLGVNALPHPVARSSMLTPPPLGSRGVRV